MTHAFALHGKHFVLDINSGSVHVTDPVVYYAMTHWGVTKEELQQRFPQDDLEGVLEAIEQLVQQGKLFAPDVQLPAPKPPSAMKALCLHVAHSCNLACDYCFAGAGEYHGKAAVMPLAVGQAALDFLLQNSGAHKQLEVDFFGGEPLLAWQTVKDLVAYARQKEQVFGKTIRFTLTTNGLLLDDEVSAFCNREMHNVVLSLDGRPHVHDRLRRHANGKGSYAEVVPKFQRFVAQRGTKSYYMRGTFTQYNTDFVQDLLHMRALGFGALAMEPVVCEPGLPYALTEADVPVVQAEYRKLAYEMAQREGSDQAFSFYHFHLDLQHGPCLHKRLAGCGAGNEYLAVAPTGELYPCHQFVGEPAFVMGDVHRGIVRSALRERFAACTLRARPTCLQCWAKYYCAGGCAANAHHFGGSIEGTYAMGCELFKTRLECAIYYQASRATTARQTVLA